MKFKLKIKYTLFYIKSFIFIPSINKITEINKNLIIHGSIALSCLFSVITVLV